MSLGLLVALENANKHTHRQDSCFISIDTTDYTNSIDIFLLKKVTSCSLRSQNLSTRRPRKNNTYTIHVKSYHNDTSFESCHSNTQGNTHY